MRLKKRFNKLAQKFGIGVGSIVARSMSAKVIEIEDGPKITDYKIARAKQEEEYLKIYGDPDLYK